MNNRKLLHLLGLFLLLLMASCTSKVKQTKQQNPAQNPDSLKIDSLSKLIRNDPTQPGFFIERARIYEQINQPDKAIADLLLAVKTDSVTPEPLIHLAELYLSQGKSGKAKEMLEKCIESNPENTDALLKLAEIHFLVQQYNQAVELIAKVSHIDPLLDRPYFLKGLIYKENGDTAKAIENLQISTNRNPENYHAYMELGALYAARNDSVCLDYFRLALKLNQKSIEALYNMGMFYQNNNQPLKAIESYQRIIDEIDPEFENAFYNIGWVNLELLNNYKKAIEYFDKTIELKNNYYQAWHNRGYANEMLGHYQQARSDYRQCLNILPNYPLSIEALNRLDKKQAK